MQQTKSIQQDLQLYNNILSNCLIYLKQPNINMDGHLYII